MADDRAFQDADDRAGVACRALTVRPSADGGRRPMAGFVAQLIASESRMAQFRRARREDPTSAAGAYKAGRGRGVPHIAVDLEV